MDEGQVRQEVEPNSEATELCLEAVGLYSQGKYEEALEYCEKALKIDPDNRDAWYFKGLSFYRQGKFTEALRCCDRLLQIDINFEPAWCNKGLILLWQRKVGESLRHFEQVLKIRVMSITALQGRAVCQLYKGNKKESDRLMKMSDALLQSEGRPFNSWCNRGDLFFAIDEFVHAKECFEKAKSIFPNDYYVNKRLSEIEALCGDDKGELARRDLLLTLERNHFTSMGAGTVKWFGAHPLVPVVHAPLPPAVVPQPPQPELQAQADINNMEDSLGVGFKNN